MIFQRQRVNPTLTDPSSSQCLSTHPFSLLDGGTPPNPRCGGVGGGPPPPPPLACRRLFNGLRPPSATPPQTGNRMANTSRIKMPPPLLPSILLAAIISRRRFHALFLSIIFYNNEKSERGEGRNYESMKPSLEPPFRPLPPRPWWLPQGQIRENSSSRTILRGRILTLIL